jgi:lipoyl(octanoyl) transferase
MDLHLLPARTADAAGNMAVDFLLLQRYPPAQAVRFRHYDWRRPAFTFGYAQKIAFVRSRLPPDEALDITRRATGGGLVDHREDWTYALVLPRQHPLWDRPGPVIYERVHEAIAAALNALGADVGLQRLEPEAAPGVCFERPEVGDVVRISDGVKVAGAALKRGKHGVLFQGSIWRPFAGAVDWTAFEEQLPVALARSLEVEINEPGWPEFDPDEEQMLVDRYASNEWIEAR